MKKLLSMVALLVLVTLLPMNAMAILHLQLGGQPTPTPTPAPTLSPELQRRFALGYTRQEYPAIEAWIQYYQKLIALAVENDDDRLEAFVIEGKELADPSEEWEYIFSLVDDMMYRKLERAHYRRSLIGEVVTGNILPSESDLWYVMFYEDTESASSRYAYGRTVIEMMAVRAMTYAGMIGELSADELTQLVWYLSNPGEEGIQIELDGIVFCAIDNVSLPGAPKNWVFFICPEDRFEQIVHGLSIESERRYKVASLFFQYSNIIKWSSLYP